MRGNLALIQPIDPATGLTVDIRVGLSRNSLTLGLDGQRWHPAIVKPLRTSMELVDENITGEVMVGKGDMTISLDLIESDLNLASLVWSGAKMTVWTGNGPTWADMSVEFQGRVKDGAPDTDSREVALSAEVDLKTYLDTPFLKLEFAGLTGESGDVDTRGTLRPGGMGRPVNVPLSMFDVINNVMQVEAYGNLQSVAALYENAAAFGAPDGNYPTYDALVAATIAPGHWATSIEKGLIRLGAPPAGLITCDPVMGAGTPGTMALRLLQSHTDVPADRLTLSDFTALDAALAAVLGDTCDVDFYASDQITVLEVLQKLCAGVNAAPLLMPNGQLRITRVVGGPQAIELRRKGNVDRLVTDWKSFSPPTPWWRLKLAAARTYRVHSQSEIDFGATLVELGIWKVDEEYRLGNIVSLPDGSRWLFQSETPATGSYPSKDNDDWYQLSEAITAGNIHYEDGTPMEDLKPAEPGATAGAPDGTFVGDVRASEVIAALKAISMTSSPAEVLAGANAIADALKILTQSVSAGEVVAGAQALIDRNRTADMTALEQLLLNEKRKLRFDDLTHMDGVWVGARVRTEIIERISGDEALAQRITTIEAVFEGDTASLYALIEEEATARATADSAETLQRELAISSLELTIDDEITTVTAAIGVEALTRANADAAETEQRELAISQMETAINLTVAMISAEATTRADADSAETSQRTLAISELSTDVDTRISAAIATEATTRASADEAETMIRESQISSLTTALGETDAALYTESLTRATADAAETEQREQAVSSLESDIATANALISTEALTRAAADEAETEQRELAISNLTIELEGQISDASAAIASEAITRATADLAETATREGQISTLTTTIDGEVVNREAAITSEASTRAAADFAETEARTAQISSLESALLGTIEAAILEEATTRADADSAEVAARIAAIASISSDVGDVTAMVVDETLARVTADSALASSVEGVTTTLGENTAAITELMESVDGVLLRYGLKLDSNGHIIGFIANNDGEEGGFDFVADYFRIWDAAGINQQAVFSYNDGVVRMQNVEVDTIRAGSANSSQFGGKTLSNDVYGVGFGTYVNVISKTVELVAPGAIQATAALAVAYMSGAKDGGYALYINGVNVFSVAGTTTEISVVLAGYKVLPAGIYSVDVIFSGDTTMKVAGRSLATTIVYAGRVRFDLPGTVLAADTSFSRASANATHFNSAGALVVDATDAPRFDYDPITHVNLGLLIEPSAENKIPNAVVAGAASGDIGSGGAIPTGWQLSSVGGLTRTVTALGTVNGMEMFDIRFHGTATSTSGVSLVAEAAATVAAGTTWTNSVFLGLVSGSLANVQGFVLRAGNESVGTSLSALDSTVRRYRNTRTLTGTSPVLTMRWNYASVGAAIDFTIRVGLPQREAGSRMTSPIKTSGAAATRAADQYALLWEGRNVPDGTYPVRYYFDDASYEDRSTVIASGQSIVPTDLARPHLKGIAWS